MGTITLTLPITGNVITAGLHSTNYAILQALLNGNLDNNNINAAAAIARQKIANNALTTVLPVSPVNQDECFFTDSTTAPTYVWHLKYNTGAAKWLFVGGSPIFAETTSGEAITSTTYVDGSVVGPTIALPLAGDYDVEIGATVQGDTGTGLGIMSYSIGGTAAVDADAMYSGAVSGTVAQITNSTRPRRKTGLTAVSLVGKYKRSGGSSIAFSNRWMRVTPVKVI